MEQYYENWSCTVISIELAQGSIYLRAFVVMVVDLVFHYSKGFVGKLSSYNLS
jgi:hypothetical protein